MDKDEFQAWKDSPATKWVLDYLRQTSGEVDQGLKRRLSASTGMAPSQWAELQPLAAHDAGYLRALRQIIELEYEQIEDERVDA